ncbi:MAG: phenylalanine--tRNA ligase subunit beta, partial [Spirochaetae bacterium HGW-Spirochaetae-6]
GFDKIVVGQIQKKEQHPNADKLTLCKVDVGGEILSIICGAKNHQEGDKVVVSMIGAVLPGGMEIKRAKLRGVESEGMICSKTELGLAASSDGVWILPPQTPVGASINTLLPQEDYIYDVSITANRSDCLSTLGVAREVAIIEGKNVTYPKFNVTEDKTAALPVITIKDQDLCYRYASRIVRGVKVGPSPEWLQEALGKYGARSINNIVDITNYVMFELGQPLHAFDLAKLDGKEIVVRRAAAGEKLVTLDEVERTLDKEMLIIADKTRPVAIAGVMGGANSEVDSHTVDLLLESAYFVPHSVRKTAKQVGLRSEASYRFERDADPENTVRALDMCTQMILELAG